MSTITTQQVAHLAGLSRIDLTETEIEHLAGELNQIVEAVATVQEVTNEHVAPTSHPIPLANVFREDEVVASLTIEQALNGAPESEGSYFRVAAVLEENEGAVS